MMAADFTNAGYALLAMWSTMLLWTMSGSGVESHAPDCQPCGFNPLCSCTQSYDSLGEVHCADVYFPRVPHAINRSRLTTLHLRNNDLNTIEPYFLVNTGLYKMTIQDNPLTFLTDDSLYGLEYSLWELELINTHITYVPSKAIRALQKLKILNLSGNQISEIRWTDWNGLENTLKTLKLANNALTHLPQRAFDNLLSLEYLDLSGNMISELHTNAFENGPLQLKRLNLADNLLKFIPYIHLSSPALKFLKNLDVSYNLIDSTKGPSLTTILRGGRRKFTLDELHLEYNHIKVLEPQSLQNFEIINKTYLDGNPITHIQDGAFKNTKIRELYLVDCDIYNVSNEAFRGLESYLHALDVSNNNITDFPVRKLQQNFNTLMKLGLRDNKIKHLYPIQNELPEKILTSKSNEKKTTKDKNVDRSENIKRISQENDNNHHEFHSLQDFDFSGWNNGPLQMNTITGFKYVRQLSLPKTNTPHLDPTNLNFTIDMEELRITGSDLKSIKAHAFKYVHGLKYLDLSDNAISLLDAEAFKEIGHSLEYLKMSHSFSTTFKSIPGDAFRYLSNLKYLELSNNHLQYLRESNFHYQTNLRTLKLQDCMIDHLHKGTFQSTIHSSLKEIYLSFNSIKKIDEETFEDLQLLGKIHLDGNRINRIEKHAFINMESLRWLILRGNQIEKLEIEAFQNLPKLQELDLAYNYIKNLDFTFLDQVGMLSYFRMNVSHNLLTKLSSNLNFSTKDIYLQSNIRVFDISYNSIKTVEDRYFMPMETSLSYLYMSHNQLWQVSRNVFGNFINLVWLDIGHNQITEMGFDAFRGSRKLQVFIASHNRLMDLPSDLFKGFTELRLVDFSYNKLRVLPDTFFNEDCLSMEALNMAHNELSRMPVLSFATQSAGVLCDMDVSYNVITTLPVFEMFSRFKSLKRLNLAGNRLMHIEDSNFASLIHLTHLDLSHNDALVFENRGRMFLGLEQSLQNLKLKNVSLTSIPELPLPSLLSLDLSVNNIATASSDRASNLSLLRHLDLSYNQLNAFPPIVMNLPELNSLNLAGNHIYDLSNSTFTMGVSKLIYLDLSYLPLVSFETGALNSMKSLQTLIISTFVGIRDFNIPSVISDIHTLRNLNLKVDKISRMGKEFTGFFPYKLRNFTISGKALHGLTSNTVFQGLRYPNLNLTIFNTSLDMISNDMFRHMGRVRNVSLDIRNNSLKTLGNPSTNALPKQHGQTFLTSLKVSGNPWTCDCSIGWIEVWHRKKRQFLCDNEDPSSPAASNRFKDSDHYSDVKSTCFISDEDLETATCADRKKPLAEAFKFDIECGWGAAGRCQAHRFITVVVVAALMAYHSIMLG